MAKEKDGLLKIVLKLGNDKKDLRIKGMENIHPIYEALTSLLRSELQDKEISERYAKNETSLSEVIATDVLLRYLEPKQKDGLKSLLNSGSSLKEIVERAAVYLSNGKREKEGMLLCRLGDFASKDKSLLNVLKKASMNQVYIERSEIYKLEKLAEKRKKTMKRVGIGVLIGSMSVASLIGGYLTASYLRAKNNSDAVEEQIKD